MDVDIHASSFSDNAADTSTATKEEQPPKSPASHKLNKTHTTQQQLKTALWSHLGHLVDTTCLGLSSNKKDAADNDADADEQAKRKMTVNATPQFIAALTELVHAQIKGIAGEVEGFARTEMKREALFAEMENKDAAENAPSREVPELTLAQIRIRRHANRTTVQTPDVLLLARKNPDLEGVLKAEAETFRKARGGGGPAGTSGTGQTDTGRSGAGSGSRVAGGSSGRGRGRGR
ncbi:MAG: hypothetical protein M1831_003102 [Alyxoria varia]|nr:MAG: hypothetical protein M1831_003102 [Alyxoria varia]